MYWLSCLGDSFNKFTTSKGNLCFVHLINHTISGYLFYIFRGATKSCGRICVTLSTYLSCQHEDSQSATYSSRYRHIHNIAWILLRHLWIVRDIRKQSTYIFCIPWRRDTVQTFSTQYRLNQTHTRTHTHTKHRSVVTMTCSIDTGLLPDPRSPKNVCRRRGNRG